MTGTRTRRAQALRSRPTDAERPPWQSLRRGQFAGRIFHRQYPLGRYFVDFVCFEPPLVIEVDGNQHAERAGYDRVRDRWLVEHGFRVMRFSDREVLTELHGVTSAIWSAVTEPPPQPSPTRGEGARGLV